MPLPSVTYETIDGVDVADIPVVATAVGDTAVIFDVGLGFKRIALSDFVTVADIDTLAELNAILTDATLIDTSDSRLSDARTPTAHTHTVAEISDASANGRTLISAANYAAMVTLLGTPNATLTGLTYASIDIGTQVITLSQINLTTDVTGVLPLGNMAKVWTYRGTWASPGPYVALDAVTHNNAVYVANDAATVEEPGISGKWDLVVDGDVGGGGGGGGNMFGTVSAKADLLTSGATLLGYTIRVTNSQLNYMLVALPATSAANWVPADRNLEIWLTEAEYAAILPSTTADLEHAMIVHTTDGQQKIYQYDSSVPQWVNIGTAGSGPSVPITMSGAFDYITLVGQDIVRGQVDLTTDVTGVLPIANYATGTPTGNKYVDDTGALSVPPGTTPVTATAPGTQKRHGFLTPADGTSFALTDTSSYNITGATPIANVTGMVAANDGETIKVYVRPAASIVSTGNISLSGALGDIITPTFGTHLTLQYVHADGTWYETSRTTF